VAIPAKYLAMAWQFQTGGFLAPKLRHRNPDHKLGSDMLHYTDLTQFKAHIVLWWQVGIMAQCVP
jgi:hypothetical protein